MVQIKINLSREENRKVGIFKANNDLSSKEEAIKKIIRELKMEIKFSENPKGVKG